MCDLHFVDVIEDGRLCVTVVLLNSMYHFDKKETMNDQDFWPILE